MKILVAKALYQLYGVFSICLFTYGLLWTAQAICDKENVLFAVLTVVVGSASLYIAARISEDTTYGR